MLKADHFTKLIEQSKGKASDMWKTLKQVFPAKTTNDGPGPSVLILHGILITCAIKIANCLKHFLFL